MSDPFLGEIRMFAGTFAPQGWALCNGATILISENDALYTLLGTTYGGDGVSTFGLPNLLGRVPIHDGQGSGLSPYSNGDMGGSEAVALQAVHHPAHSHAFAVSTDAATLPTIKGNLLAAPPTVPLYYQGAGARAFGLDTIGLSSGGGQGHENRMPSIAITYIIALAGVYPSKP